MMMVRSIVMGTKDYWKCDDCGQYVLECICYQWDAPSGWNNIRMYLPASQVRSLLQVFKEIDKFNASQTDDHVPAA